MEEKLNAITHGTGTVLAICGLIGLAVEASKDGQLCRMISFCIYGASLVLLYLASTLYHSFRNDRIKYIFKICDHAAIYLLIAGTYTPFTLVTLHGSLGWTVFGVAWGLAAVGIVFQLFFVRRFKVFSTLCYTLLGWLIIIVIKPLSAALPVMGINWLIAGGVLYTAGTVFYLVRRIPYNHAVWHLFVMAGSAAHFIAVIKYVNI